jgi:hypothetical protein
MHFPHGSTVLGLPSYSPPTPNRYISRVDTAGGERSETDRALIIQIKMLYDSNNLCRAYGNLTTSSVPAATGVGVSGSGNPDGEGGLRAGLRRNNEVRAPQPAFC